MRTDSTNLSKLALNTAKKSIEALYGAEYSKTRQYRTNAKGAQEAHEAIRPTYLDRTSIEGTAPEKKLYDLIWKRTIASQMADAKLEKTDIEIVTGKFNEKFTAQGSQVIFDGFLKVYMESHDDDQAADEANLLPALQLGQEVSQVEITATQKYTAKPLRYTEASLVKKMEELGIGRPSTYAPTITTQCIRVPVTDGHTAAVFVKFENKPTKEQILEDWKNFKGLPQELGLPHAPEQFITYFEEDNRPQAKLDRDIYGGMGVTAGRLREDSIYDYKFVGLSHNTLRGAAGGAVEMAELYAAKGYFD